MRNSHGNKRRASRAYLLGLSALVATEACGLPDDAEFRGAPRRCSTSRLPSWRPDDVPTAATRRQHTQKHRHRAVLRTDPVDGGVVQFLMRSSY